ncbi:MAG: acyl-CoA dehydrogenase, partial [Chloroflexota bacterium]
SLGARGISMLLVKPGTPGFTIESMGDKMGLRGTFHGILRFRDCRVPVENLLGKEGEGLDIATKSYLDPMVMCCSVDFLGASEKLLELSARWAQTRVTFGRPIADRQAVKQMLADMAVDIQALKCMIRECAQKFDRGESIAVDAAMCKLFGSEAAKRVSDQALLIHGGMGYTKLLPVERIYRDIRSLWFEEGTPTIQRLVIARDVMDRLG